MNYYYYSSYSEYEYMKIICELQINISEICDPRSVLLT